MNDALLQLARAGRISWLSYYFAEFIARHAGNDDRSVLEFSAALVCEANRAGHVCIDLDRRAAQPWFDEAGMAPQADAWRQILEQSPCVGAEAPLTLDGGRLYLNRYWHYESAVAAEILNRLERAGDPPAGAARPVPGESDADQDAAVGKAIERRFCVVSGGPGSGKTSTVVRILLQLRQLDPGLRIALAAPTGRAAARMMESIQRGLQSLDGDIAAADRLPQTASTVHRLLGYRRHGFEHDRQRPLALDCVVVDEASMIDLRLMFHLLDALPPRARLILLGDRDQLASVAAGNVLGDITGHGLDLDDSAAPLAQSVALLRQNYRFGDDSAIGELAARVNRGDAGGAMALLRAGGGLHWHETDQETADDGALQPLINRYQSVFDCSEPGEALRILAATRLLCAVNHGPLGVGSLNRRIGGELLARQGLSETDLYHGLPIMITRNQHDLALYNGDTGILWQSGAGLRACFDDGEGGIRYLALNRLPEFEPAWAITVHKAQGSEYDSVMLMLPADPDNEVLARELLYTAITRARRSFHLQAGGRVVRAAIARLTRRHSGLSERLGWRDRRDD